jgi:uroporphyrinogen decarboxylase
MTAKERFYLALNHKEGDQIPMQDSPWSTTIERWRKEGMPDVWVDDYFGFDHMRGQNGDTGFRMETEVIEETDEFIIVRNGNGAITKNWKHTTSTPEMIDFTINSREKWEEYKPRLAWADDRADKDPSTNKGYHEAGDWVNFSDAIGYDRTQAIVGSERLLTAMAEDPDWAKDMFMTCALLIRQVAEQMVTNGYEFDGAFLYDDMGYRNGALFSPRMYREMIQPAHKHVCDFFRSKGKPVILHSCGCVKELIPDIIDAGFTCLQPLEVKAGMDVIELKKAYGDKLAFMGGIDVRKMAHPDPKLIEEEIATKIPFAMKGGGYIYHSDHSVPDNISFQQYCHTIDLVKKYGKY